MKGQVVSILIAAALVIGIGAGYFAHTGNTRILTSRVNNTSATTAISTYTLTADLPQGETKLLCVITQYEVWMVGVNDDSTFSSNVFTQSYNVATYQTTTPTAKTSGFAETTVSYFTGTVTGPVNLWNTTVCTYLSS